jgi:hypothetical protein
MAVGNFNTPWNDGRRIILKKTGRNGRNFLALDQITVHRDQRRYRAAASDHGGYFAICPHLFA